MIVRRPFIDDMANGLPWRSINVGLAATAVANARPPDAGPSAHTP